MTKIFSHNGKRGKVTVIADNEDQAINQIREGLFSLNLSEEEISLPLEWVHDKKDRPPGILLAIRHT